MGCCPGALSVPENPKITVFAVQLLFLSILFNYSNQSWGVNYKKLSYLGTQESWESRQVAIAAGNRVWVRSLGLASCLLCSICCSPPSSARRQNLGPAPLPNLPSCPHFSIRQARPAWELSFTSLPLLCKYFLSAVSLLTAFLSWFLTQRQYCQTQASRPKGMGRQGVWVKRSSQGHRQVTGEHPFGSMQVPDISHRCKLLQGILLKPLILEQRG